MVELFNSKALGIYGSGGFGREIYDTAVRSNEINKTWNNIFFIDDFKKNNFKINDAHVLSFQEMTKSYQTDEINLVVAVGEPSLREKLYNKIKTSKYKLTNIIDPSVIVSPYSHIGNGVIICAGCIIANNAVLEDNVCINVNSIIGHDIHISESCSISSNVNIGGSTFIDKKTYIGMGAMIKENLKIGSDTIIGMSSVVYHNIKDSVIAVGNPARVVKNNIEKKVFKNGN